MSEPSNFRSGLHIGITFFAWLVAFAGLGAMSERVTMVAISFALIAIAVKP